MTYEQKVGTYMEEYILEYGQRKFLKIMEKLLTSNSVRQFLLASRLATLPPLHTDIIGTVMNILYFGLSRKTTVAIASIMLLQTWSEEVNKQRGFLEEEELSMLFDMILKKCLKMM